MIRYTVLSLSIARDTKGKIIVRIGRVCLHIADRSFSVSHVHSGDTGLKTLRRKDGKLNRGSCFSVSLISLSLNLSLVTCLFSGSLRG